jgi:membrane-associated phospholipid phosphatase
MRIILTSLCVCLVLLFVFPNNATAQSTTAVDSMFSAIELAPDPTRNTGPAPVAFDNCDTCRLALKTHKVSSFATLFLSGAEASLGDHTSHEGFHDAVAARTAEPLPSDSSANLERGSEATTPDAQEPNPLPEHTGFGTLAKDTVSDFVSFPKRKSTWVILASGGGAALLAHQADDYVAEHIVGNEGADKFFKVGKVVGSAGFQVGTALGLWIVGRYIVPKNEDGSRSNKFSHLGLDLLRAQIVSQAMVYAIKYSVQRDRPTGECCAFPSGHATSAFSSAAVFERHFGERGSWWALTAASYVAASRLVDNRHFLSDVVFGAALGEAVGWTVVGRHGRDRYVLRAVPMQGGGMIAITNN